MPVARSTKCTSALKLLGCSDVGYDIRGSSSFDCTLWNDISASEPDEQALVAVSRRSPDDDDDDAEEVLLLRARAALFDFGA